MCGTKGDREFERPSPPLFSEGDHKGRPYKIARPHEKGRHILFYDEFGKHLR